MSTQEPLYDAISDEYEEHAKTSPYNAQYDRPSMLGMLGDLQGAQVLDAGCGPGFYASELLARGATVTAFDQSSKMVALARSRLANRAELRVHDLSQPIDWIADATQDRVVLALVLHYLDDRVAALKELHRVLRPGGKLVLSTHHPTLEWQLRGGSYFATELIEETWNTGWKMRYWRLPLEQSCAEFAEAGFLTESIVEPRPIPEMRESDPIRYEKLMTSPNFINFRLVKQAR
tara:strand:- start:157783 stop:158481 length:699 start_codon:yes stop_codon:yes gene_type:complete